MKSLLDINILILIIIYYINFKHYNIPTTSNIINIILYTANLYNSENSFLNQEEFRIYCGKILTKLFNTSLKLGYDDSIFHN